MVHVTEALSRELNTERPLLKVFIPINFTLFWAFPTVLSSFRHSIYKSESVSFIRSKGGEVPTQFGPLERSKLD
jgi:hypothetical protein